MRVPLLNKDSSLNEDVGTLGMKLTLKESEKYMTGRHYRTVRETIKQEAKGLLKS